jgi:hypothetical protein
MMPALRWPAAILIPIVLGLALPPRTPAERPSASGKKLYVIAPAAFHRALAPFIEHKRRLLPTQLIALDQALKKGHGVDDPERLKRFLYDAWKHDQLGYAILVGDVDVMPVRYMVLDRVTPAAFDYAFYPSDLYYSDLAHQDGQFDDWNAHKEDFHAGYFGEVRGEKNKKDRINYDNIDYRADIAVGRWPVSTPREAAGVAAKTIAFEESILAGKHPGEHRAAFFAVDGWVDSRDLMDRLARQLPAGWSAEKRYYRGGNRTQTPPPDEKELLQLLNGGVSLVLHAGHGSANSWEGCFPESALPAVHNRDRLPIMISAGCSTAHFAPLAPYAAYMDVRGKAHRGTDHGEVFRAPPPPPSPYQRGKFNPSGLGEQLLRRGFDGAVAYIGCNTGSQPCGLTLLAGFVETLHGAREPRLGDCWAGAITYYYEHENLARLVPTNDWYPPSIFFQGMKFMLFGDPSLRLPGPAVR